MSEDLSKLKVRRGQLKGNLTRFRTFLNALDLNIIDQIKVAQISARLDKFQPTYDEFIQCQNDIELLSSSDDTQMESSDLLNFENDYFDLISRASVIISNFEAKQNLSESSSTHSQSNASLKNIQGRTFSIKLPEMKLPTFSGSYDKWLEFRDAFSSMIDKNESLDTVQKFYYLRAHLEGEAAKMIESIKVTEQNYDVALSLLKQRYENNRLIIFNYVKALFDAPSVTRESYSELRNLYDTFTKNLRCLEALGQATDEWSTLLVYLLTSKFDSRTRRDWETYKFQGELPNLQNVNEFLKEKCELLEKLEVAKSENKPQRFYLKNKPAINAYVSSKNDRFACFYCKNPHSIFKCNAFAKLDLNKRNTEVKRLRLCLNCLSPNHSVQECPKGPCKRCSKHINSLLHTDRHSNTDRSLHGEIISSTFQNTLTTPPLSAIADGGQGHRNTNSQSLVDDKESTKAIITTQNSVVAHTTNKPQNYAILSTAVVDVKNKFGKNVKARVLLDPGSQSNFITESFCSKIGVIKVPVNYEISGVGNNSSLTANFKTNIKICSQYNDFSKKISCLILPSITQAMPICDFDSSFLNIPGDIQMADPNFNIRDDIDILCGVGVFYEIILMNQIKLNSSLILLNTKLGWVLGGELSYIFLQNNQIISCHAVEDSLNENLLKFWQIEECNSVAKRDDFCETHFKETFRRDDTGRFVVKIPFKDNLFELGNSKEIALRRFNILEKRLAKNDDLRQQYVQFINEYQILGHMTEKTDMIDELSDGNAGDAYYLPHHAIVKESITTRLRVVFDASAKSDSGLSLNDVQHAGPQIQNDLFTILLNFRKYLYVISADISKMYRQILIDPNQRRFQRIFWRDNINENIKCFELNTVTYGMSSAPYSAIRCLHQLALENEREYPVAAEVIKNCFYVDDLLAGRNSENEILNLQRDLTKILASAGLELRKWLCNKPELYEKFKIIEGLEANILELGVNEQNKTLGVFWNASSDVIKYRIRDFDNQTVVSKRIILSTISQIFDPLGLLGPLIMNAKLILQSLWKEKLSWDQEVSNPLRDKWLNFCNDLKNLKGISVPRYVFINKPEMVELHLFADASEKGYGACAYIKCRNGDDLSCNLLCAKSKIAPIKRVTLPRLELCAAVLAVNLANKIKESLNVTFDGIFYWSDSTITLHWINGSPDRWKLFVANRVSFIQSFTESENWLHVRSEHNPADLISRGISATQLLDNKLWWNGPCWLKFDRSEWKVNNFLNNLPLSTIPEHRPTCNMVVKIDEFDPFSRFSTLAKLKRVIAYCKRFTFNCKNPKSNRISGVLTVSELKDSFLMLIRLSQKQSFKSELNDLKNKGLISRSSNILSLHPFLDNDIIRVGGRIQKAIIPFSKKHPIILHNKHKLTELIMTNEHLRLMHCGPQQLLYSVREHFWPISGRNLARQIVHKCIVCYKVNPKPCNYLMGNLPAERLNQCTPFSNTGCDFAGFFLLKDKKNRGYKLNKAYVCIFVCLTTKAIHLELVTSLSSDAFLSTLRRFIARRGKPLNIFSDNGTNFTGANSEIQKFLKLNCNLIKHDLADEGINWHFIPPRAPHFGGLWEAGVKSLKQHLKRVVGNTYLDYEDFSTVLLQIEAILNSRPLSPLSSSPDDVIPLTPGHFLIGRPLVSLPDYNVTEVKVNRLTAYQRLQQITQHFWKRWYKEYVSELQIRQKWRQGGSSMLKIGDLVIIKDDNLPPLRWKLARVVKLFSGTDGVSRVVDVRFSDGTLAKRAINKVCLLPIER